MVSGEKQIWHCFGCGLGGDVISFVMQMEGLEFYDALKLLADRAGVKLKQIDNEAYSEKKQLYDLNELAMRFFRHILLNTKPGEKAKDYLKKRNINDDSSEEFQLGYIPNQKDILSRFLVKKKIPVPLAVKSGLVIKKDYAKANELPIFDRFRGRVIFPIFNQSSSCVGFTGRIMPQFDTGEMAKYLNSSDSPIFNKSFILYGLNLAKREIMDKDFAILVEGQMDVISSHQFDFKNTVASSGTSLTQSQLDLLKRFTDKIYFAFDQDQAGQIATERGVELAVSQGFFVYIVLIPKAYKDVDECLQKDPKLWQKALDDKKEFLDYLFLINKSKKNNPSEVKQIIEKILPWVNKIQDPIVKGGWFKKISDNFAITESYLYEALDKVDKTKTGDISGNEKNKLSPDEDQNKQILIKVLALAFVFPKFIKKFSKDLKEIFAKSSLYKKILKFYTNSSNPNKDKFLAKFKDPVFPLAVLEVENDYDNEDLLLAEKEFVDLLFFLKNKTKHSQLEAINAEIRQAEKDNNQEKVKNLLKQIQDVILKK